MNLINSKRCLMDDRSRTGKPHFEGLCSGVKARQSAFTLIELLVVIAIIAILAAIMLPVLDKAKKRAVTAQCLNNMKQLQTCYIMYVQDNNDFLAPNNGQAFVGGTNTWSGLSDAQNDYSTFHLQTGLFWQYNKSYSLYACPANTHLIKVTGLPTPPFKPGQLVPQTRTCTIDFSLNVESPAQSGVTPRWKMSQLTGNGSPGICQKIVFVDDNELEVSGSAFGIFGNGHTDQSNWWNVPGARHNNGATFSFIDGHVEYWHWRGNPVYIAYGSNPTDAGNAQFDLPRLESCEFQENSTPY